MPRDGPESDLVDTSSDRFYSFIQAWNSFGSFTVVMRKFCLSGQTTPQTKFKD